MLPTVTTEMIDFANATFEKSDNSKILLDDEQPAMAKMVNAILEAPELNKIPGPLAMSTGILMCFKLLRNAMEIEELNANS
jgi:hypothetical protein